MVIDSDDGDSDDDSDDDDDDDDCQFVKRPNIHGKAMLIVHTGVVSLPDEQRKTNTEKKSDRWKMVQSLM